MRGLQVRRSSRRAALAVAFTGSVALAALAQPLAGIADDGTAVRGLGGCLWAEPPTVTSVGTAHVFVAYRHHDECSFPTKTYVEHRVRHDGEWKDWEETNRGDTMPPQKYDPRPTRTVRIGGLKPARRYQVRAGISYFGNSTTDAVEFETDFTPYHDVEFTLSSQGGGQLHFHIELTGTKYGRQSVGAEIKNPSNAQHWEGRGVPEPKCHVVVAGRQRCVFDYHRDIDNPVSQRQAIRIALSNPVYAEFAASRARTPAIEFVGGKAFSTTVGLDTSK